MSYPILFGTMAATAGGLFSYTGEGTDGDAVITSNTFLTVPNKNGAYDGDMVVRHYSSLNIDTGVRLSPDQPCRGMLIYVQGNCTINGRLSMTGYGASANPTVPGASDGNAVSSSGLILPFRTLTGTTVSGSASYANGFGNAARTALGKHTSGTGTLITIQRDGAAGNTSPGVGSPGNPGANGSTGQSGGGGSGGSYSGGISAAWGSNGYIFAGGAGGGGADNNSGGSATNATQYGGGGRGGGFGGLIAEGGAGNPHGPSTGNYSSYSYTVYDDPNNTSVGNTGPGGLLILVVGGTLTIGATGSIEANGNNPALTQANAGQVAGGGGCSGGGNVVVAYKNISNGGSIMANGGNTVGLNYPNNRTGGNGGNGSVQTLAII